MSIHDPHSEKPKETPAPPVKRETDEETTAVRRRRASPALRLSAWMLALVILLVVLVWAIGGVL